jgi:N-acetylmuramoyl-L-alanine amidase
MRYIPSQFFNDRQTNIDVLMFHCSALSAQKMVDILNQAELSCHYIVDTDGSVTKLVEENKRAWHAGLGSWRKIQEDMNSHSIGIELSSPSLGQNPYPQQQIESLITLSKEIINRWHIKPQNIIGHSDSAPTRKPDPGKAFPWQFLARHNIGLWYDISQATQAPTDNLKTLLSGIGYDTSTPENYTASQYAFARRFLPEKVNTVNDIQHLIDNVYPPTSDFSRDKQFITVAQAVYMRFKA